MILTKEDSTQLHDILFVQFLVYSGFPAIFEGLSCGIENAPQQFVMLNHKIETHEPQISEEGFAHAYQKGFRQTERFLLSRGIPRDLVFDTAQTAWTKAWERRAQLRQPSCVLTWINSIALNVYRTTLRRRSETEELVEKQAPTHEMSLAAIDAKRMLKSCRPNDRTVLESYYIYGYGTDEIARKNAWSETAVRIRLVRARRRVNDMYDSRRRKAA